MSDNGPQLIWYDAIKDNIFQSRYLEALFLALAIRPDWWSENPHIELIGSLEYSPRENYE